jgi:molybdate transport system permease protein
VPETPSPKNRLRKSSDAPFFICLGVIGGTYVTLIVGILLADIAYIFSADQSQTVDLDFNRDDADRPIASGSLLTSQFDRYGLGVRCENDAGNRPTLINNFDQYLPAEDKQPTDDPLLSRDEQRAMLDKNLLVATRKPGGPDEKPRLDEPVQYVFSWKEPVQLKELRCVNIRGKSQLQVALYGKNGQEIGSRKLMANPAPVQLQKFQWKERPSGPVSRLVISLPPGGAITGLRFVWGGHVPSAWEARLPFLAKLIHSPFTKALSKPEIQYSIRLSLISCTITAILSLWVAIPIGYLMSRYRFFGHSLLDAILDIPIVLPPLVVGLSLLIAFQFLPVFVREIVVYEIPAVILAQFMVACAFAVRTMRATFDQIDVRHEHVALTLGCSRFQAFYRVVLPDASRGALTAATLAWARALGEFGPLLIFAGATRNKTEVLSTTVFLEMNVGDLGAAVAVSLIMVTGAVIVLIVARIWGTRSMAI